MSENCPIEGEPEAVEGNRKVGFSTEARIGCGPVVVYVPSRRSILTVVKPAEAGLRVP
jgi:hypothetical protein